MNHRPEEPDLRVVLVHGLFNSAHAFNRLLPLLGGLDVITPDLPGHGSKADQPGLASVPAIAEAIRPEIRGPGIVLGHSFGGLVATALAERWPDLVTRLVIVNSGPTLADRIPVGGERVLLRTPLCGPLLWRSRSRGRARASLRRLFAPGYEVPDLFVDDFLRVKYATFVAGSKAIEDYLGENSLYRRINDITPPTTVVFGQLDQRTNPAVLADYSSTRATVVPIPNAGHTPPWETPDQLANVLLAAPV